MIYLQFCLTLHAKEENFKKELNTMTVNDKHVAL